MIYTLFTLLFKIIFTKNINCDIVIVVGGVIMEKSEIIYLSGGKVVKRADFEKMNKSRMRLYRLKTALKITAASLLTATVLFGLVAHQKGKKQGYEVGTKESHKILYNLSDEQILTTIRVYAHNGDTISNIANKYFNKDNAQYYGSQENFQDAIATNNHIIDKNNIDSNIYLNVPVVLNKNDQHYKRIIDLQNQINTILNDDNLKWMLYTDKGEVFSELVELSNPFIEGIYGSNDWHEIIEYNKAHNKDFDITKIQLGDQIYIHNPKLWDLRKDLNIAETLLEQSLINPNYEEVKTK